MTWPEIALAAYCAGGLACLVFAVREEARRPPGAPRILPGTPILDHLAALTIVSIWLPALAVALFYAGRGGKPFR